MWNYTSPYGSSLTSRLSESKTATSVDYQGG